MLKKIYIDGFRHFKNFSFEPYDHATLLSGLNGTGKTSIVETVNKLQLFLVKGLPVTSLCPPCDIPIWAKKVYGDFSTTLGLDLEISDAKYSYELEVRHNFKNSTCRAQRETLKVNGQNVFSSSTGDAEVVTDDNRTFTYPVDWAFTGLMVAERNSSKIKEFLKSISDHIFSISINPFSMASGHQEPAPILDLDGSNFSAWYECLLGRQVATVVKTFAELSSFIPGFKQFVLSKEGKRSFLTADVLISNSQTYQLPFENLSHGQKILCLLHLLIRICPENSTILVDEFENFLAPVELQPLYDVAQDAFEEKNTRFIFVSHHQKTMNWFHDSAFILSFSGAPSFVRLEKFRLENGLDLIECLKSEQEI